MSSQAMKFTDEKTRPPRSVKRHASSGFSLIEMMIALVLGLIVIAGAGSVFVASRRTYQTNHALSDVQQNSRIAFEIMARDIRDAGLTGCSNDGRVANILNDGPSNSGTAWWANWNNAVHGYDSTETDPAVSIGSGPGERVSTTDSLELLGANDTGLSIASHDPAGKTFTVNESSSNLQAGDAIVVCDPDHSSVLQTSSYTPGSKTIGYGAGGNCSSGLGFPAVCTSSGTAYQFSANAQVAKLTATDWYIGNNGSGTGSGTSLYRRSLTSSGGVLAPQAQEMVRNVTGLKLAYHQGSGAAFIPATSVTNWGAVDAVRVTLTLQSSDQRAGTGYKPVTREFTSTTTVRNRVN